MSYKIVIENIFGVLNARVVHDREQIQPAALELISAIPFMSPGDKMIVVEIDVTTGKSRK